MTQPRLSIASGLVGCWSPPNKGSGGLRLPDLIRGNHGVFTNITADDWRSSQYGWSINCNTSYNAVINCGSQPQGVFTQPFTMLAWVYNLTASPDCAPMAIDGGNNFIMPWISGGIVNAYWASGVRLSGVTSVVSKLQWQLIAISWTGDTAIIYVNNKVDASATVTTAPNVTNGTMVLGTYTTGATPRSMAGLLGECATFSRALSLAEISEIYRLGNGGIGKAISFGNRRKALGIKPAYQPPKAKVFEGVRVRDHDYASLRQGLVGAWCPSLANGGSGNLLVDQSGRGNNGVLTGMGPEDWVASEGGRALDIFDDQYVDCGTMNGLSLAYPFSLSAWIFNATGQNDFGVFGKITVANLYEGVHLGVLTATNGVPYAYWKGAVRAQSSTIVTQRAEWIQLGICWTGTEARVIINGRIDATGSTTTAPNAGTSPVSIGRYAFTTNRSMRGLIDDCRMYDRCLTDSEWRLLASKRGIGLQPSPTRFIAKEKKTGLRRLLLTGQT